MKAQPPRIALALAGALIGVSFAVGAGDVTPGRSAERARSDHGATIVADSRPMATQELARIDADAHQSRTEERSPHRNSPHPAVLSYERPVLPIGVPNPPVSLERY